MTRPGNKDPLRKGEPNPGLPLWRRTSFHYANEVVKYWNSAAFPTITT